MTTDPPDNNPPDNNRTDNNRTDNNATGSTPADRLPKDSLQAGPARRGDRQAATRPQNAPPSAPATAPAPRHIYGPRPLGALIPPMVRPAFKKRAPATAQVLADWDIIMGPAISAVTTPRKLFAGTLSIACVGPVAMELQHLAPTLIGRINAHMGQIIVSRLRFVQDIQPQTQNPRPPPRKPAAEAAHHAVATLPEGELRDALESLGRMVLSTPPARRR